ncbi:DNA-directed RNA polymerase subunit omega [Candidatus Phytoplasma solani]|uniref:DNA-directed RNA polymerase subunit omega n=2 Tax=Candidatus Phytoplasma solani TaxID=69896 RepID=A0A421NY94_9MOLU|nr:DNA-directed RNA polymerase subunit omega [Candidatus Phytoplasma solani]RMI89007.1 DNA-directed RNA polymerase subunit omega [Candidatus Phytoplasma solani]CCP88443.1 DNA-directed RNA polymerase omega chain [Candidatus Phytoplasma solani]
MLNSKKINKDGLSYPSIDKLLDKINSKYKLVHVASKIAHVIETKKKPLPELICNKVIGKALEEIINNKVKFVFKQN